jgi:hypothetical protein
MVEDSEADGMLIVPDDEQQHYPDTCARESVEPEEQSRELKHAAEVYAPLLGPDGLGVAPPDGREAITTRLAAYACVSAQAQEEG